MRRFGRLLQRLKQCGCGCGQDAGLAKSGDKRKGIVKGQENRFLPFHHTRLARRDEQYIVDPDTGCWEWQLRRNNKGYGLYWVRGAPQNSPKSLAHRVYYERFIGPIPEGLSLDHLCNNPSCVNPDHMEPVTVSENSKRRSGTSTQCLSLNFIAKSAMNEWKRYCRSGRLRRT